MITIDDVLKALNNSQRNALKSVQNIKQIEAQTLAGWLSQAFDWYATEYGPQYWSAVCDKLTQVDLHNAENARARERAGLGSMRLGDKAKRLIVCECHANNAMRKFTDHIVSAARLRGLNVSVVGDEIVIQIVPGPKE